jgi:hypothetical protein
MAFIGAQFVAHVREELALGAIGFVGGLAGSSNSILCFDFRASAASRPACSSSSNCSQSFSFPPFALVENSRNKRPAKQADACHGGGRRDARVRMPRRTTFNVASVARVIQIAVDELHGERPRPESRMILPTALCRSADSNRPNSRLVCLPFTSASGTAASPA